MTLFNRTFYLVTALCLAAWLIAVVPAVVVYAGALGSFSFHDMKHSAITVVAIAVFAGLWSLLAGLMKLLVSDWLASRRQQRR